MLIASYSEWYEASIRDLKAGNKSIECPVCNGWGCEECEFEGDVPVEAVTSFELNGLIFTESEYFKEVIGDLKRYCAYTGTDFLDAVAPFIQEFRAQSNYPRVSYHGQD